MSLALTLCAATTYGLAPIYVYDRLPTDRETISVVCPTCGAPEGITCVDNFFTYHGARSNAARRAYGITARRVSWLARVLRPSLMLPTGA